MPGKDDRAYVLELVRVALVLSLTILVACAQRGLAPSANNVKDASPETQVDASPATDASPAADARPEAPWFPPPADAPSAGPDAPPMGGFCGNGILERNEECDDGNTRSGDGCTATCLVDPWPCDGCIPTKQPVCGDGRLVEGELCDDGNHVSGDGCSADCQTVEPGWRCRVPSRPCAPICGDLVLTGTETCDDGNTVSDDGCSMYCLTEPGWDCASGMCTRTGVDGGSGVDGGAVPTCGDGVPSGAEECDFGAANNDTEYGGCTTRCFYGSFCGDGVVDEPYDEDCDLGRDNGRVLGPDGCTVGCRRPHYCGDGFIDTDRGEECDLGERNGLWLDQDMNPTEPGNGAIYCWDGCHIPPSIHYREASW